MKIFGLFFLGICSGIVIGSYFDFNLNIENVRHLLSPANRSANKTRGVNTWEVRDKEYNLRIIVIVYDRAESLLRLLGSLNKAEYDSDSVKLEVWIDRSEAGKIDSLTLKTAENFTFSHGEYSVNPHPRHVGLYGQWLTTWKPKVNSSEKAVILEDDLTVSPFFYKYLKLVHNRYDKYPEINGYALQGNIMKHSNKDASRLHVPKGHLVFLYPVLGSWGFSPNRNNWMKFLDWFTIAFSNRDYEPYVPGYMLSDWYKVAQRNGKSRNIWTIWHAHYAWKNLELHYTVILKVNFCFIFQV